MIRCFRIPMLAIALLAPLVGAGCSRKVEPGRRFQEPETSETFVDVRGGAYRLPGPAADCRATALIFVGHDCPISNGYAPEIGRLVREFGPQGIAFCVVYADPELSEQEARRHALEFGYPCPAILDPSLRLAVRFGATFKPEAVVLSPTHEALYLGRIDDSYVDVGRKRLQPTKRDLRDALVALVAGRPAPFARTPVVGCPIDQTASKP